jgi:hypothetical protein
MVLRSLFACAVALFAYCGSARAALVEVTYTGTMYNSAASVDGLGLFGTAGASLAGQTVSVIFTFDVSGPVQVGPGNNYIAGSSQGVDITINGITHTIGGQFQSLILGYNDGLGSSRVQHEAFDSFSQYVTASLTDNVAGSLPKSILDPFSYSGNNGTGFFRFTTGDVMTQALFTPSQVTLTQAVPEPSTWAMMLLGFAGIGYMAYRRSVRSNTAITAAQAA